MGRIRGTVTVHTRDSQSSNAYVKQQMLLPGEVIDDPPTGAGQFRAKADHPGYIYRKYAHNKCRTHKPQPACLPYQQQAGKAVFNKWDKPYQYLS